MHHGMNGGGSGGLSRAASLASCDLYGTARMILDLGPTTLSLMYVSVDCVKDLLACWCGPR